MRVRCVFFFVTVYLYFAAIHLLAIDDDGLWIHEMGYAQLASVFRLIKFKGCNSKHLFYMAEKSVWMLQLYYIYTVAVI